MFIQSLKIAVLTLLFLFGFNGENLRVWAQENEELSELLEEFPDESEATEDPPDLNASVANEDSSTSPDDGWVIVEPPYYVMSESTGKFHMVPYRLRRTQWGYSFSVSYSNFEPGNYQPNFVINEYSDIYSGPELPLLEFQISLKYNFFLGAAAVELGAGMFKEESDSDIVESQLELLPIRLGVSLILDTLFDEPYLAPYVSGGVYTMKYSEKLESTSENGFTQAAPYYAAGIHFQLDWIDSHAAREAYQESGIENTFLFVEGRKFLASSAAADPDFETDYHINGGLKIEF